MTDDDTTRETLSEISHTNPYTNRSFGQSQIYGRGKIVAADGGDPTASEAAPDDGAPNAGDRAGDRTPGRRGSSDETAPEAGSATETLGDVPHVPPGETAGAHRAYERGFEGKDGAQ